MFIVISPCKLSDSRVSHDLWVGGLLGWGPLGQFWGESRSFGAKAPSFYVQNIKSLQIVVKECIDS